MNCETEFNKIINYHGVTLLPGPVTQRRGRLKRLCCWLRGHKSIVAGFDYKNDLKLIIFCQCQTKAIMAVETGEICMSRESESALLTGLLLSLIAGAGIITIIAKWMIQ